tara:strand:+ start:1658 stop:1822 length:165 start_codon:yes stop_codon:yes gene_type:complete
MKEEEVGITTEEVKRLSITKKVEISSNTKRRRLTTTKQSQIQSNLMLLLKFKEN